MPRINSYAEVDYLRADDKFVIDGDEAGTRSMLASSTLSNLLDRMPGKFHRGLYKRDFELGKKVEEYQLNDIRNGNFTGMFLGDYWTIDGVVWRIVDFDYFKFGSGKNFVCAGHHVVVMPTSRFGGATHKFHDSDDKGVFYKDSSISQWLDQQPAPSSAFLKFNVFRTSNANGDSTNTSTGSSYLELPSASQLGITYAFSNGKLRRDIRPFAYWNTFPYDRPYSWTVDTTLDGASVISSGEFANGYTTLGRTAGGNPYPYALIG